MSSLLSEMHNMHATTLCFISPGNKEIFFSRERCSNRVLPRGIKGVSFSLPGRSAALLLWRRRIFIVFPVCF